MTESLPRAEVVLPRRIWQRAVQTLGGQAATMARQVLGLVGVGCRCRISEQPAIAAYERVRRWFHAAHVPVFQPSELAEQELALSTGETLPR